MQEVEVKILEIDVERVIQTLLSLSAKKIFDGNLQSEFYDFPDRRLHASRTMLRLRTLGTRSLLTLKETVSDAPAKIRKEYETAIDDPAALKEILERLGLKQIQRYPSVKWRRSYALGNAHHNAHVEIDVFPGLPPFLEVEGSSLSEVQEVVQRLGFSWGSALPWSEKDVLKHYKKLGKIVEE